MRVPPACPYKPTNTKSKEGAVDGKAEPSTQQEPEKVPVDGNKEE